MTERYEDIIVNGEVVGQRLVADRVPVQVTQLERTQLLARMTPVEVHGWIRATQRALATNTPTVADRDALYAWTRWQAMQDSVDLTSADIVGLAQIWIALGMTPARAQELLAPLVQ